MRFSIVIPVFKTERFLPRCLDSLVAQTNGDFEAIVVDDASPGDAGRSGIAPYQAGPNPAVAGRPPYLRSVGADPRAARGGIAAVGVDPRAARYPAQEILAKYDSRFRYIRHEKNRSAFQARCTGVGAAKGDYIVPVDPDDYLLPATLAKLREVIDRENPDLISYRMEYDNGKKIWPHWCRHANATVSGFEALRELTEHTYFTGVASKAFRRETLQAALCELNAPEDLYVNTCDDFLMLVPMLMKSEKVSFLDFVGYRYFVNGESTSFSWKTHAGYRRALAQVRVVNGLVTDLANRTPRASEELKLVAVATKGIEDWFVEMRRDSLWPYRLARRLLRMCSGK